MSTLEGKEGEKVRNGINQAMQRKGKNAGWSGANGDRKQALDDKLFGMGDDEDEEEKEKEGGGDVEGKVFPEYCVEYLLIFGHRW